MTDLAAARAAWSRRQHLHAPHAGSLHDLVAATGWLRTLGGAEAYLALAARQPGTTVADVHRAIAQRELVVAPAVRGCVYVVPFADLPLALATARSQSEARLLRDLAKAGCDEATLHRTAAAVSEALAQGPATTAGLRAQLGDAVVSLGDVGKKIGLTSTLPPALRWLEWRGRVLRAPEGERLDHDRYTWVGAEVEVPDAGDAELARDLAEAYLRWCAPGSFDGFVAWTGLGKRVAKAGWETAADAAGCVPVALPHLPGAVGPATSDAPTGRATLLPGLDNLTALHPTAAPLVAAAWHGLEASQFGTVPGAPLGTTKQLYERTVARDGELVGFWAYDPDRADVEVHLFPGHDATPDTADAVRIVRDLGHARAMSLDNDDSLRRRRDRARAAGGGR